ncbi:MAG: hypothetical protein M3312_09775, partial [Actinomycetota bacterium]|nr:hypothetical protein [Actinomycetota bacterium]
MARRHTRASMREGPLAELFKATEAAQRQVEKREAPGDDAEPVAPEAASAAERAGASERSRETRPGARFFE